MVEFKTLNLYTGPAADPAHHLEPQLFSNLLPVEINLTKYRNYLLEESRYLTRCDQRSWNFPVPIRLYKSCRYPERSRQLLVDSSGITGSFSVYPKGYNLSSQHESNKRSEKVTVLMIIIQSQI